MVLSESEAEARLAALRRQREAIDRAITDLTLYLELGRRLTLETPAATSPAQPVAEPVRTRREPVEASPSPSPSPSPSAPADAPSEPGVAAADTAPDDGAGAGADVAEADGAGSDLAEGALARRYGRALVEASLSVLAEAGRPLHASEIVARLASRGFTIPGQQDPVAALNTRLWKRSGPGGPFRRLGDAVYALPEGTGVRA